MANELAAHPSTDAYRFIVAGKRRKEISGEENRGTTNERENGIITGGSAGIGKATGRAFGESGASVIVSRTKQRGQATEAELREGA